MRTVTRKISFAIIFFGIALICACNPIDYKKAIDDKDNGLYEEAATQFVELGDYKDSKDQLAECRYLQADDMKKDGLYEEAATRFAELGDYKDSEDQLTECRYLQADDKKKDGLYEEAATQFAELGDYKDSAVQASECLYLLAEEKEQTGDIEEAVILYEQVATDFDVKEKIARCAYAIALNYSDNADYEQARKWFEKAGNYQDAEKRLFVLTHLFDPTTYFDKVQDWGYDYNLTFKTNEDEAYCEIYNYNSSLFIGMLAINHLDEEGNVVESDEPDTFYNQAVSAVICQGEDYYDYDTANDLATAYLVIHEEIIQSMLHAIGLEYSLDKISDIVSDSVGKDYIWEENGYRMRSSLYNYNDPSCVMLSFRITVIG